MKKKWSQCLKNQKGFTLTELIVVLLIIGILAAVAIPIYMNVAKDAKKTADEANINIIESAIELYAANKGEYPEVSGDGKAQFAALMDILTSENYIKKDTMKSAREGCHFEYDSKEHKVDVKDD